MFEIVFVKIVFGNIRIWENIVMFVRIVLCIVYFFLFIIY